jgi:hypothetical protein
VEVLERIRIMVARKRGPKKTSTASSPSNQMGPENLAVYAS